MKRIRIFGYLFCISLTGLVVVVQGCHLPGAGSLLEDEREDAAPAARRRVTREVTLDNRTACGPDVTQDDIPLNRLDTSDRVARLRQEMAKLGLDAYIIPTADEHQSEYVAPADERRRYITGFSGSAGTAVVTTGHQALWTDGRYFLQADQQMDCNWLLMKQKNPGVPTLVEWLRTSLMPGSKVGADARLIGAETWTSYAEDLAKANIELVVEEENLVDIVWPKTERPSYSQDPVFIHELQYAGKKWEDKVKEVREEMVKKGADMLVVTALDEVAWLLNLRGNDIPYNPVFRGYVVITRDGVELYLPTGKITPAVDNHLHVNQCDGQECVAISEYSAVFHRLRGLRSKNIKKVLLGGKYSYSGGASYAVFSSVPAELRMKETSPVLLMKARKNPVERKGMKDAHIKDAVALTDFLSLLEQEILDGRYWSEISAAERLKEFRAQQEGFVDISFGTISAYGANGAVIHYQPVQETNLQITNTSLYLLDSGGQFKDGTTDVTRTLHYGHPTELQVEAYTRVLMGAVDLATLVFPEGTGDTDVDILARRHLYEVGLDYRHGTGHGIGMFLNVHEAPIQVRIYGGEEHKFEVGHFFSDEPGYYQDGEFGIRLENILTVIPTDTPYHFDKQSLAFEPVTLVPFEPLLINASMLSARQCRWVNSYHARVRDVVGGELMTQGRTRGYEWVVAKTEPLPCVSGYPGAPSEFPSRRKRSVLESSNNRTGCMAGDVPPQIRVNTSSQVSRLREEMSSHNLDAYIIPISGEQGYGLAAERRLGYLTGFTGSAGLAVVTTDQQALWTDGRYFLQADDELDCAWLIMKERQDGVPTVTEWLRGELSSGARVGADPRLIAADTWKKYAKDLNESSVELVAEEKNLVDLVWPTGERPPYPNGAIYTHDIEFAGKRWEDKVREVREEMVDQGADMLVVTAMDEVAWLLNLRGSDVENTPVFRGYAIVDKEGVELFVPPGKITPTVDHHLNVNQCGQTECVTITAYTAILNRLRSLKVNSKVKQVMLGSKYSYSGGASYAIYSAVPEEKRLMAVSPVLQMKARKNPVEAQGMKAAHLRDGTALCAFLAFMEREITAGNRWDEIEAASKLRELRGEQQHFVGLSFSTISAFGPNGAIIHYRPQPDTNRDITIQSLYLVDSGGQYKDGTTDVTRTLHYGHPTDLQVEAYTRVLMGAIDLATLVFPEGTGDTDVDIMARRPLYEVGLDYRHGTGHGIGHFLGVHEAPTQVRIYSEEEHKLEVGHFFSDEPGYYDQEWGIRLETILTVVPRKTKYVFDKQMLGFEAVTLAPFEAKLINLTLLSDSQCEWLNSYHMRVRDEVGPELVRQGRQEAYEWLVSKTEPLPCPPRSHQDTITTSAVTTTTTTDDSKSSSEVSSTTKHQTTSRTQAVTSTTEELNHAGVVIPSTTLAGMAALIFMVR